MYNCFFFFKIYFNLKWLNKTMFIKSKASFKTSISIKNIIYIYVCKRSQLNEIEIKFEI